jgi:hypothetical protein
MAEKIRKLAAIGNVPTAPQPPKHAALSRDCKNTRGVFYAIAAYFGIFKAFLENFHLSHGLARIHAPAAEQSVVCSVEVLLTGAWNALR